MSVSLQKGQKVDLTKGNTGVKHLLIGLGWDAAEEKPTEKRGFFKKTPAKPQNIDCDASVIVCDSNGKMASSSDLIYFGRLKHQSGAIVHNGDNLTGDGDGDDEQILVDLEKLPAQYAHLYFVVNIYQAKARNQHFGMIKNAFIRVVNADTNIELCKFDLSENYDNMTAMICGEVYQNGGEWKFNAIGQPTQDLSIAEVARRYQ